MKKNVKFVLQSSQLLLKYQPWKLFSLFLLSLFLGLNQGFSIVLLLPFLQLLNVSDAESSNHITDFFNSFVERSGISLSLELILITYVIVLSLTALISYFNSMLVVGYQQGFIHKLRKRLFRKIILSDWPSLSNKSKHNHIQVLAEEVPKLGDYYYFYLKVLTTVIIVIAHLFFAFMMSAKFSLFVLLTGVVSFMLLRRFLNKSYRYGTDHVNSFNRLLKYIDDFWQTVKISKVHNTEKFYYKKFEQANSSILSLENKMLRNQLLPQLLSRITGILILVIVIYAESKISHVPLVSFFILIIIFARIMPLFIGINSYLSNIVSDVATVKLVMDLDAEFEERSFNEKKAAKIEMLKEGIRIESLHFAYPGGETLFSDFNAHIPAGKLTGIIGSSGLGKTTLIDMIAGLLKPDSGKILIDAVPLDQEFSTRWKQSIGYLPQEAFFIDGSIRENLVWDSDKNVSDENIWAALKSVNACELVEKMPLQLDTFIVNHQYRLSGGERQRLALARVLLRDPSILILDEATSSLDTENEKLIMDVLVKLKTKVTILLVTHRSSLLPYFDELIQIS